MSHGDFIKAQREAKGHDSAAKLATYAKTLGYSITGQAIRNFERGQVPNAESRELLGAILHLNAENHKRFIHMCAYADIQAKWGHLDLFIVDEFNRSQIARHVADTAAPNLPRAERREVAAQVEAMLCNPG